MNPQNLSFSSRFSLALSSFFSILSRPEFAADVQRLRAEGWPKPPVPAPSPAPVAPVQATSPVVPVPPVVPTVPQPPIETAAWQLLGLLQREARFIDFIEEDIKAYGDADIGAGARVVHEGCRKVLREHFSLAPVRTESEGSRLTLPAGFDASAVKVIGHVVGQPPFTGTLAHRGWQIKETRLPQLADGHDARILAQAEVEL